MPSLRSSLDNRLTPLREQKAQLEAEINEKNAERDQWVKAYQGVEPSEKLDSLTDMAAIVGREIDQRVAQLDEIERTIFALERADQFVPPAPKKAAKTQPKTEPKAEPKPNSSAPAKKS